MKHNVLVVPCGSEIGLELHRSLQFSTHFELFGASSVQDHGAFVYKNYVGDVPFVDDPKFTERLNQEIKKHDIKFIFPAHDSVVLKLAEAKESGEINCEVITSPAETCRIARSKKKTYEELKDVVAVPHVFESAQHVGSGDFPVFLKPDVGQGSKGTHLAKDQSDLEFFIKKDPTLLILENLPGKEYTIDCFTNKDKKLLFCEGRERARIQNGISVNSKTNDDKRFIQLAEKINQTLDFRGVWFFQVKENTKGELVLMEIAPRVAGTMGLIRAKGVNLPILSLFDALGLDVAIFKNSHDVVIDRALRERFSHDLSYDHVYIDFDDLIIFENKVNPYIMAFIYQSHNNGKKVHLITRHRNVLSESLEKYRLTQAFDSLIHIKEGGEKYPYITEKSAIFIDDSFAERKKVHDHCGIPTFDSHMIESLMEKF